jgi:hypothetical protein
MAFVHVSSSENSTKSQYKVTVKKYLENFRTQACEKTVTNKN